MDKRSMRQVNIALGLIQQGEKFLLQLRDGEEKIGAASLIGCFGGKIGKSENPTITFCREISEETSLKPQPKEVKNLGTVSVHSDHQLEKVKVKGHVFHWQLDEEIQAIAKEGKLIAMTLEEAKNNLDKLTPATRAIFEELV